MIADLHPVIRRAHINEAMTYEQYLNLIDNLLLQHKTTGPDQSEAMVKYTELNRQRMRKWDKITVINDSLARQLENFTSPMVWLVLTEAWCGDAAQNLPVIAKMAALNPNITLRFLLRDEHLDIMDAYLTGSSRSIPKLIALDAATLAEKGTWGPRPAAVQQLVEDYKSNSGTVTREQFYEQIHAWYAHDKNQHIQQEFAQLLDQWQ